MPVKVAVTNGMVVLTPPFCSLLFITAGEAFDPTATTNVLPSTLAALALNRNSFNVICGEPASSVLTRACPNLRLSEGLIRLVLFISIL